VSTVIIRIPMITSLGPRQPSQMQREFQGSLPTVGPLAFVAHIIREGLESAQYPDYQGHNALPDEYLVQEKALVKSVPNDVWIRNGLTPLGDWEPVPAT
jgi:hypothetical protein